MTRARTAAVVAVFALLLAACGSSNTGGAALVRRAPDETLKAGSAKLSLKVDFSAAGTSGTITGDGAVDLKSGRADVTLDVGSAGAALGVTTAEAILDKGGIYLKLPPSVLTGNKPWIKLNLGGLANQAGVSVGSLGQLQSADPSQAIQFLRGATSNMDKVGTETLRGDKVDHYRGRLDLKQAADAAPDDAKLTLNQTIAALGRSTLPADVWLDSQGRMRKLGFTVDPDGTGPGSSGTVELELYDFGTPANVAVPPDNQVTDLSSLFGGVAPR